MRGNPWMPRGIGLSFNRHRGPCFEKAGGSTGVYCLSVKRLIAEVRGGAGRRRHRSLMLLRSPCSFQPGLGRVAPRVRGRVALCRATAGADAAGQSQVATFERLLATSGTVSLLDMRPAAHQNGLFTSRAVKKGEVRGLRARCHHAWIACQPSYQQTRCCLIVLAASNPSTCICTAGGCASHSQPCHAFLSALPHALPFPMPITLASWCSCPAKAPAALFCIIRCLYPCTPTCCFLLHNP